MPQLGRAHPHLSGPDHCRGEVGIAIHARLCDRASEGLSSLGMPG